MADIPKWYFLTEQGVPTGPLSTKEAAERLAKRKLAKETLFWCDGRSSWQCAEGIAEIQAALGAVKPTEKEEIEKQFVDDDGTIYVWNEDLKKYEPKGEYDLEQMTFPGEEEAIPTVEEAQKKEAASTSLKRKEVDSGKQASDPKKTTSVYVTGLPRDVTMEEMAVVFSKCGLLKEDEDGVKIKIYRDKETGKLKGDGLVTYMKRPSVDLAIQILDGTPFREKMKQTMTIQEARFEFKGTPKQTKKPKSKKPKKMSREDKLLGWGGFDDHLSSHQITVILKNMFHPTDFATGDVTKEELKQDVMTECQRMGEVDRVTVYADNEEGVVMVRFRSEEAADECIKIMNGRYFAQRKLSAHKWDGFTKYYKAQKAEGDDDEARLEKFSQDLEGRNQIE